MKIYIENIDAFIFDFDGVLTNNLVHIRPTWKGTGQLQSIGWISI